MIHKSRTVKIVVVIYSLALCTLASWRVATFVRQRRMQQAIDLNKAAWEATYTERGLPVPEAGPREGYWGSALGKKVPHETIGWIEREISKPEYVEIDANGMQHVLPVKAPEGRVLIVGASVAWGAYASTIAQTYFSQLMKILEEDGHSLEIYILAAGAWKSGQELTALMTYGLAVNPSLVIFLNGTNDLRNGSSAAALNFATSMDGKKHEHDFDQRVEKYLENMNQVAEVLSVKKIPLVVALQPALFEKAYLSLLERELEPGSYLNDLSRKELQDAYAKMRQGLLKMQEDKKIQFLDLSRIFGDEPRTTFTDLWHFSDPGHALIAKVMENFLKTWLITN